MVLLRTLIESETVEAIARSISAPQNALSLLSAPAPVTFLSSVPPLSHGASDGDDDSNDE